MRVNNLIDQEIIDIVQIKRVYEPATSDDGTRYLVDRLWPRGIKKEALQAYDWLKEVAPSTHLRKWFNHDPKKWIEFERRYEAELDENLRTWTPIFEAAKRGKVTLLYAAKDQEHNHALVLKKYIESKLAQNEA